EERVVSHRLRHRADLVEARGEGDDAVARDGAVGRAQTDVAAKRGGLLDRAAPVGAESPRCQTRGHGRRGSSPGSTRHALGIPWVARRAEGRVLRRRAHCELVCVRLPQQLQARRLAAHGNGRIEHRDVVLEDLRAGSRTHALRGDDVLEGDRDAVVLVRVDQREEAVQVVVAGVDRLAIGRAGVGARHLATLEQAHRILCGESEGVDHSASSVTPVGGTRKKPPSRSGAFAKTSSSGSDWRGSSGRNELTTASGCEVGGTSERSSSDTLPTAVRMSFSCTSRGTISSSVSSRRASPATWSTSSLEIGIGWDTPQRMRPPFGGLVTRVPKGKLDRLDVRGLRALRALHDLELNSLTLGQRLVSLLRDGGEVDEDVLSTLALDESVALLVRKPLHGALS